jgi:hypothetical protein
MAMRRKRRFQMRTVARVIEDEALTIVLLTQPQDSLISIEYLVLSERFHRVPAVLPVAYS